MDRAGRCAVKVEEMEVTDQEQKKTNSFDKYKQPRRIYPTRVPVHHESMQTEPENNVAKTEPQNQDDEPNVLTETTIMQCQIEPPNGETFRPYDGFLDSIFPSQKQDWGDEYDFFKEPKFLLNGKKMDPMEMDIMEILNNKKYEDDVDKENVAGKNKWNRCNSAPAGLMTQHLKNGCSFPHNNTLSLDPNDSSLDKWDMMKTILEETEAIFKPMAEFGSPVSFNEENVRRPFDYDESFSPVSSTSTNSAAEVRGMETGDLESESTEISESDSGGQFNNSFALFHDDLYGQAPIPSPNDPNERSSAISSISVSSLNDSLSRLACRGGSGEKRKQSEVATPTKDENRGRKVRLESPRVR